jgi:CP family cyanate transporter-like MFS transporter
VASLAVCVGGWWGCAFAPRGVVWIGAVALGAGQGAVFAIGLMLFVLRAGDARATARLSGMAQGVGYLIASLGPLLAGLLHGWSGEWWPIAWLFAAIGLLAAFSGLAAGRAGQVHG